MDGWLVKPGADALAADWFMTWPATVRERFGPGLYDLHESGKWATWTEETDGQMQPSGDITEGHVFVSYVREDASRVDDLEGDLEAAGLPVWRDVKRLWPGDRWKRELRKAIQQGALAFVPCFSAATVARSRSVMFEELTWAAEEYRIRNPDHPWIFPVFFDNVEPPTVELGAGATLGDLQWTLLFEDWEGQIARLSEALIRLLGEADGKGGIAVRETLGRSSSPRGSWHQVDRVQRARELLSAVYRLRDWIGRFAVARVGGEPVVSLVHDIDLVVEQIQRALDLVRLEHRDWRRLGVDEIAALLLPFDNISAWQHHLDPNREQLDDQLGPLAEVADLIHKAELGVDGASDYLLEPIFEQGRQLPPAFRVSL